MTLSEKAYTIAEHAHRNQTYGNFPYTYHLYQVVDVATKLDASEDVVIACILHDILEDTSLSYNDLKNTFGEKIADIVFAVTDELGKTRAERKRLTYPKIAANKDAVYVKICDRIANGSESKKNNQKLYEAYKSEHPEFIRALGLDRAVIGTNLKKGVELLNKLFDE